METSGEAEGTVTTCIKNRKVTISNFDSGPHYSLTWPTGGISGAVNSGDVRFNWPSEKPGTDHIGDLQGAKEYKLVTEPKVRSSYLTVCMVLTEGTGEREVTEGSFTDAPTPAEDISCYSSSWQNHKLPQLMTRPSLLKLNFQSLPALPVIAVQ